MSYEALRVEVDEGMATPCSTGPLNTLSIQMRRIRFAVEALEADPAIRVLILTGAGRVFTAGLDLDEWGTDGPAAVPTTPMRSQRCSAFPAR